MKTPLNDEMWDLEVSYQMLVFMKYQECKVCTKTKHKFLDFFCMLYYLYRHLYCQLYHHFLKVICISREIQYVGRFSNAFYKIFTVFGENLKWFAKMFTKFKSKFDSDCQQKVEVFFVLSWRIGGVLFFFLYLQYILESWGWGICINSRIQYAGRAQGMEW